MPALFGSPKDMQQKHSLTVTMDDQKRVKSLMDTLVYIKSRQCAGERVSGAEETQYAEAASEVASLIASRVQANSPHDLRQLFSIPEPPAQWSERSKRTVRENYAWLDERALYEACHREVDVSHNSSAPSCVDH